MIAYPGNEPFVFMSYSHTDKQVAESLIVALKRKMCRVFYDEGLTPGESWNDELAKRVLECDCIVVLLTNNSVSSKYVKAELNYAITKDKTIVPIMIENTQLPPGIEMMLIPYQFIIVDSAEDTKSIDILVEKIINILPQRVFSPKKKPFLEHGKFSFFFEQEDIQFDDPLGRDIKRNTFKIACVEKLRGTTRKTTIFSFGGDYAYDIHYSITQCNAIGDDFFLGRVNGLFVINIVVNCNLNYEITYPYGGPDFNCLLVFSLRVPSHGLPSITLIDYKYITINGGQISKIRDGSDIKHGFGRGLSNSFEQLLYRPYRESYPFFGADSVTRETLDLFDDLSHVWSADTCELSMRGSWSPENPSIGQDAVTAFLVRDLLGGSVYGIPMEDGKYHCYNELKGIAFDFTSMQFGKNKLCYENNLELSIHSHFSEDEQQKRYNLLKERLEKYIIECTRFDLDQ